jgi:lactate permease
MNWLQNYDPLNSPLSSTLVAALPVVVLLGAIAALKIRIHIAAVMGLGVAVLVATWAYRMPAAAAAAAAAYGAAYGLFPIGWIILNLIFLYQLTVRRGLFDVLRGSFATLAPDPRIQLILVAFSFGAFFEGAAGFGTPVAVTSVILIRLGFPPLSACGLSLIANTAPVAYGALGTPIEALSRVTELDKLQLSAMAGRQLPFFSLLVPFWVVWAFAGFRGMLGVWPVALVAGAAFAVPQLLVSNFHGPWLVDIVASVCSVGAVVVLLKFWKPAVLWNIPHGGASAVTPAPRADRRMLLRAWMPWILLTVIIFVWGACKGPLNRVSAPKFPVPGLHQVVVRTPPVVAAPTLERPTPPERAEYEFQWLSATGTGILVSAVLTGMLLRFRVRELLSAYWRTLGQVRYSLLTIAAMLALGFVTKYSGADATLGLALAKTGTWYPFFGALLGWLGVALTGSDTASNVLFGGLQRLTAEQTGVSPVLMAAANSSGGVMGKMVDAQSIVVASTATNWYGHEGAILRYVFFHSLALACLMGVLVYLQARVPPFTYLVVP